LKRYGEAKEQYEIALRLDDNHALGHCNYATILMQMVDKKYNQNLNDNSNHRQSKMYNNNSYGNNDISYHDEQKRQEYLKKSEYHFKRSISLNANLVMAYNNYGCLLRRLQRFDEAKTMFQKALVIDPKFAMAIRNLKRLGNNDNDNDNNNNNNNNNNNKNIQYPINDNSNENTKKQTNK